MKAMVETVMQAMQSVFPNGFCFFSSVVTEKKGDSIGHSWICDSFTAFVRGRGGLEIRADLIYG